MNKFLLQLRKGFAALQKRDQIIATAAVVALITLSGNILLLKPQVLILGKLQTSNSSLQEELNTVTRDLAQLDAEIASGKDRYALERQQLKEMLHDLKEVEAFLTHDGAGTYKVSNLLRSLTENESGITLISMRTLPVSVFYAPPAPKVDANAPTQAAKVEGLIPGFDMDKVMSAVKTKKEEPKQVPLTKKTLYKHSVEVNLEGSYTALLSYMDRLQSYPKRLFWADATLSNKAPRVNTLKLVISTLSDQPLHPFE